MPGKRQPTDVVKANGRKHLSSEEENTRRDREVHLPPAENIMPPRWLSKKHHEEFRRIADILNLAGMLSELDYDILAQYFISREDWIKAEKQAAKAIREKDSESAKTWTTVQGTYFKQARQCAESMGLSITSRCRLVVPSVLVNAAGALADDSEDEFTQILEARKKAAIGQ